MFPFREDLITIFRLQLLLECVWLMRCERTDIHVNSPPTRSRKRSDLVQLYLCRNQIMLKTRNPKTIQPKRHFVEF